MKKGDFKMKSCHLCVNQDICVIQINISIIAQSINIALSRGGMVIDTPYQELTETIAERCNRFDPIN